MSRNPLLRNLILRNLSATFCVFALFIPSAASFAQDAQDVHPLQGGQGVHSEPTYITNLKDHRFDSSDEDWTNPALTTSHLKPTQPLVAYVDDRADRTVSLVDVQWRRGDGIDLYVIKPKGVKKPPVILHLYGYPSETDIFTDPNWQKLTTEGGFASVGFVTALTGHRYHDIPWKKWFLSELQQCLGESTHDVQMVLNYLQSRGDLDMDRVGVFGQYSGATVGILASAADPRIKVLDTLDPWGDWPTWMERSPFPPAEERSNFVRPEFLSKVASLETLQWMPKVQAKKFRLQQRSFDTQTPGVSKNKLKEAVPAGSVVTLYTNRNQFDDAVGKDGNKSLDWIKEQLRSQPEGAPDNAVAVKKSN